MGFWRGTGEIERIGSGTGASVSACSGRGGIRATMMPGLPSGAAVEAMASNVSSLIGLSRAYAASIHSEFRNMVSLAHDREP